MADDAVIARPQLLLWGMSGTGKSSVAPCLAAACGGRALDLDAHIEQQAGCSIANLFARDGEAAFRALERQQLHRWLGESPPSPRVIALGGGALVDDQLCQHALQHAYLVVLQAPLTELVTRLTGADDRPLLTENLAERLQALHQRRATLYAQGHQLQPTGGLSAVEVARAIAARWRPTVATKA